MSVRVTVITGVVAAALGSSTIGMAAAAETPGDLAAAGDFVAGRVLVKYAPGVDAAAQVALERGFGARAAGAIPQLDVRILEVPEGAEAKVVQAFARSGKVDFAERDAVVEGTVEPNDPLWSQQWGPSRVRLPEAWDVARGDSTIVVAVLDTGIDSTHPELAGRVLPGYDFINNDSDPSDDHGHGTKSAGVAAAAADNGIGIAGACWSCSILPVKVLNASNAGTFSALANGITWSVDHGARVISMSLSGTTASSIAHAAVQYAYDRGAVLVAAAGNSGQSEQRFPAGFPEVLSVAGSTSNDTLYSWSTYGPSVLVAAPGCNRSTALGGAYSDFCGTSSATPLVAGSAALLAQVAPTASGEQIRQALLTTALPVSGVVHGRVDVANALSALAPDAPSSTGPSPVPTETSPSPSPTAAVSSGTTTTFTGSLTSRTKERSHAVTTASGPLTATLTFKRAAAMSLTVLDGDGRVVGQASGPSGTTLEVTVGAGSHSLVVASTDRPSYTLVVQHQA